MRTFNSVLATCVLSAGLMACNKAKKSNPEQNTSDTNALATTYGAKKIYLWNRRVQSPHDNVWRSCWYYKEALPKDALPKEAHAERQAMFESVSLNKFPLHDDHVRTALQNQFNTNLKQSGIEAIPCGLSAAGFGVSISAAIGSGGLLSISTFLAGVGFVNICIEKASKIDLLVQKWTGSGDAITSLQNGETGMGKKILAKKIEVDMFREAIKTAVSLGYEAKGDCPEPKEFKEEIMAKGMGE
jgi:hypothetical protein